MELTIFYLKLKNARGLILDFEIPREAPYVAWELTYVDVLSR